MKKLLVITLLIIAFSACTRIDSGTEALKVNQYGDNKGSAEPIPVKGFVWYNPFTQDIYEYPIFMRHVEYTELQFNSKDGSMFKASPSINYRMVTGKSVEVFNKFRRNVDSFEDQYLLNVVRDSYVRVGNKYTSDSLISSRGKFEDDIMKEITLKLSGYFSVDQVVSNIEPPEALTIAITNKNKLVQDALAEQNKVTKAIASAQVKIESARGDAESMKIKADAQFYQNQKLQQSITPQLIEYTKAQKWNGVLPQVSGNSTPMVDLR